MLAEGESWGTTLLGSSMTATFRGIRMTKKTHTLLPLAQRHASRSSLCPLAAADLQVELPGDSVYPESLSASAEGTLYGSSLASGGIWRVKPGAAGADEWIKPGAFGSRSTFGVLVDERKGLLWVCSNDASGIGVNGPGSATGSNLLGFDLVSGAGKVSVPLPGSGNLCNDTAVATDGSVYVTNSLKPQILRLAPGTSRLEVWLESPVFNQPKEGAGTRRHRVRRRRQPLCRYLHERRVLPCRCAGWKAGQGDEAYNLAAFEVVGRIAPDRRRDVRDGGRRRNDRPRQRLRATPSPLKP